MSMRSVALVAISFVTLLQLATIASAQVSAPIAVGGGPVAGGPVAGGPAAGGPTAGGPMASVDDDSATDVLASRRDYSNPAERNAPVVCKPGDLERQPGKSLDAVFGSDWPAQPVPTSADAHSPARTIARGHITWPRGLEGQAGLVVTAVLVGADGKPLRVEPLCAMSPGFDNAARRAAMSGKYSPAVVNGLPITSPTTVVISFHQARAGSARRRSRGDGG